MSIISLTLNVDEIDDMPCVSKMRATTIGSDTMFTFKLGDAKLWMTRKQVDELRLALKPSKLEQLVDEMSETE
tara:strand:+ start:139 stop:357 length:219 start_codon:yes stop_codon:yes gene_type:complete